jgi:hypothetical protein
MKEKIGYQIGLQSQLPLGEGGMINLVVSSLNWQENYGPAIIFVDAGFYRFMMRTGIEDIYHDIIPLPENADMEMAMEIVKEFFPVEIFAIPNLQEKKLSRKDIDTYIIGLPDDLKNRWPDLLMNEEIILSLQQTVNN